MDIDTSALPLGPQLVHGFEDFKPLQELSPRAALSVRKASKPLERMQTPHDWIWRAAR
jgi:hypothetical protein